MNKSLVVVPSKIPRNVIAMMFIQLISKHLQDSSGVMMRKEMPRDEQKEAVCQEKKYYESDDTSRLLFLYMN